MVGTVKGLIDFKAAVWAKTNGCEVLRALFQFHRSGAEEAEIDEFHKVRAQIDGTIYITLFGACSWVPNKV